MKEETLETYGSVRSMEEFSDELLNPDTEAYQKKAQKYSDMVRFVPIFTERLY